MFNRLHFVESVAKRGEVMGKNKKCVVVNLLMASAAISLVASLVACSDSGNNSGETSLYDARDGKTYKTVTIGAQTWMAENLNYDAVGVCFDNSIDSCAIYGRLYTAEQAQNVCPDGWHLPSQAEFQELLDVVGGFDNLKSSTWGGPDTYGFSALPAGKYDAIAGGTFTTWQMQAGWWLQSGYSATLYAVGPDGAWFGQDDGVNGFSVRCLQNVVAPVESGEESSSVEFSFVDERDGHTYRAVKIGDQTWMAENLSYYDADAASLNGHTWCDEYGCLYTWAATIEATEEVCGYGQVCFPRVDEGDHFINIWGNCLGVCPMGWHVPTREEWDKLLRLVETYDDNGGAVVKTEDLMSASQWLYGTGNNATGFSMLPSGYRNADGVHGNELDPGCGNGGCFAAFWTATEYFPPNDEDYTMGWGVFFDVRDIHHWPSKYQDKRNAFSVRCVKD